MFAQSQSPLQLSPSELDTYLAHGWFRMGQTIFTTNFLRSQGHICSTIWLRVLLTDYLPDPAQIKLFKRNRIFQTSIQPATLTPEKEELYLRYQQSLPFPTSESLRHLLLNDQDVPSVYDTYEVTVYDGTKLIAIGFFDVGQSSAEGIISVYDPGYKKYSLGKYLIYQKMEYCQRRSLHYFYPGYFVPGNPNFDYKLSIGRSSLQFFQFRTQRWLDIDVFSDKDIPYQVMCDKLMALQKFLAQANMESKVLNYEYFDASLIPDLREAELFDFPVFLYYPNESEDVILLIVFDVQDARYRLLQCVPFWKPDVANPDPTFYSAYVLKTLHEIHTTDQAAQLATVLSHLSQKPMV